MQPLHQGNNWTLKVNGKGLSPSVVAQDATFRGADTLLLQSHFSVMDGNVPNLHLFTGVFSAE